MKIVFLDQGTMGVDLEWSALEKLGEFIGYEFSRSDEIIPKALEADILIINKVKLTAEILDTLPKLKLICVAATGLDNIDLEKAEQRQIKVKNVVEYSTPSVVQHTFALLFSLLEDLDYHKEFVHSGKWTSSDSFTHFKTFSELASLRLGIIGMGTIGKEVAHIANAFGAEVVYYSTSGKNIIPDYTQVELSELMSTCDVISIHAPLNEKTRNLIDKNQLRLIKPGAILLNLGRGGIINETHLVDTLRVQDFKVGLDVCEFEPPLEKTALQALLQLPNVIVTPHMAWASLQSRQRVLQKIIENVQHFMDEKV